MKNVYFLSDAHLGSWAIPHGRMQERRLVRFLDSIKHKAAAVVAIVLTLGNAAQVPFQNDVDNQIENVGYTKSGKGVSVAMGDSAAVDSMQRTGIDQVSTTNATPTILK